MYRPGTVEEMKSIISNGKGLAKTNLFYVEIPTTQINSNVSTQILGYMCTSITLPSRQLSTLERQVGIDRRQLVYGFDNPTVSMNFRVLNDQKVRQFFEDWQNSIVVVRDDNEGDYDIAFPKEYVKPINIYQLEKGVSIPVFNRSKNLNLGPINIELDLDIDAGIRGKSNYNWILEDAYPVTFQSETLADGADAISEITVEFAYRRWRGQKVSGNTNFHVTGSAQVKTDIGSKIGNKIYKFLK